MKKYPLKTQTIYQFCIDYHSGQSSRGYRLVCRLQKRLKRIWDDSLMDSRELRAHPVYKKLEIKYANKI